MPDYQIFKIVFLVLFSLHFLFERILSVLNTRHVLANKDQVPAAVSGVVSPETYSRSIEYTLAKARFGHVSAVWSTLVVMAFLFGDLISGFVAFTGFLEFEEIGWGVALIVAISIANSLMHLPLEIYGTFFLEKRFGFNKTTIGTFIVDKIKGLLLLGVLGIPFLYALIYFVTQSGDLWWLWAALFVIGFQFLMMILFPLVIAPLFNKFTPLQDGELKSKLDELARKCDFATRGIFVVDGSKRSTHSNAYFTGIGKARRIVLFDTLIQQLSVAELTAVLAHEIGHYKKKHIVKFLAISVAFTFAGFYILNLVIDWDPMYQAFSLGVPSRAKGLIVISLIAGSFTFWLEPLMNRLSRKHEYEADAYAVEQTGSSEPMQGALLKLHEKNLSNMTPHPLFSAYHYSHPTLLERLKALGR
jgi:STE24 endopeptidase